MGTWGPGNWDHDSADDYAASVVKGILKDIEKAMSDPKGLEPGDYYGDLLPCMIDTLLAIYDLTKTAAIPEHSVVAAWKRKYMEVWERTIDALEPKPTYKSKRRRVLLQMFGALARKSRKAHPVTDTDITDPEDDGTRPVEGGYYTVSAQDGYRVCKVIHLGSKHCCILVYELLFKRRPRTVDARKLKALIPAHEKGWTVGAYKYSTFRSFEPVLFRTGQVTDEDRSHYRGWEMFAGLSVTPPT